MVSSKNLFIYLYVIFFWKLIEIIHFLRVCCNLLWRCSFCIIVSFVMGKYCFDKLIFLVDRSTKGASKARRDMINNAICSMRDLLPLPESARQRLSQLQIMSLACCFIRKSNYLTRCKLSFRLNKGYTQC